MEIRQAVQKSIKSYCGGWQAMAGALGLSISSLENRVYEKKGQALSLHEAMMIESISGCHYITEAMASRHNAVVVELPDIDNDNLDLFVVQARLQKALSAVLEEVAISIENDGVIDKKEEVNILSSKLNAHKSLEQLVQTALMLFKR